MIEQRRHASAIAIAIVLNVLGGCAREDVPISHTDGEVPVSIAREGFPLEQAARIHAGWDWRDISKTGESSLYALLHFSEFYPSAVISRAGPVVSLERDADAKLGTVRIPSTLGEMSLDEYLVHPRSRAQGMIVVHKGKVALETYPGMRQDDAHITMSVAKTSVGLVIALLEADGKIDVQRAIGTYVPALKGTEWNGIKVIDVLDMASGLDILETSKSIDDVDSVFGRMARAMFNVPDLHGKLEKPLDVIRSAKRLREPGERFEYSSVNTQVLVLLAEAVENRRWPEIFAKRVWSKMNAEGDAQVTVAPDGTAIAAGFIALRLRDLARFGMLHTPSWTRAAREPLVSADMLKKIQTGGRPQLYREVAPYMARRFGGDAPIANSRQWDAVFADGDLFKSGMNGQGLYVSPGKDLVMAWFSTAKSTDLPAYARAIARAYGSGK